MAEAFRPDPPSPAGVNFFACLTCRTAMKPWIEGFLMASTSFCDNDPDLEADIGDLFLNDETDDHDGSDSEGWTDSDEDSYDLLHSSQPNNETAKRLSEWLCSPRHGLKMVLKRLADPEVSLEQEANLVTKIYSHINSAELTLTLLTTLTLNVRWCIHSILKQDSLAGWRRKSRQADDCKTKKQFSSSLHVQGYFSHYYYFSSDSVTAHSDWCL